MTLLPFDVAGDGYSVWRWPEFQALMDRMGIPQELYSKGVTIRVYEGEAVTITQEYLAIDKNQPRPNTIDTTTVQNSEFRSVIPTAIREGDACSGDK